MYDLKKVEEKFHEYLKTILDEEIYHIDEIRITEELLEKEKAFYIPFGRISYFLVIEDEKPVVYTKTYSIMDWEGVAFIDENSYEDYCIWAGQHPDMREKYHAHAIKVKRYDYKEDLRIINDIER